MIEHDAGGGVRQGRLHPRRGEFGAMQARLRISLTSRILQDRDDRILAVAAAAQLHLVERSPSLRHRQRRTLTGRDIAGTLRVCSAGTPAGYKLAVVVPTGARACE